MYIMTIKWRLMLGLALALAAAPTATKHNTARSQCAPSILTLSASREEFEKYHQALWLQSEWRESLPASTLSPAAPERRLLAWWSLPEALPEPPRLTTTLRCAGGAITADCDITPLSFDRINSTAFRLVVRPHTDMPDVSTVGRLRHIVTPEGEEWCNLTHGVWENPTSLLMMCSPPEKANTSSNGPVDVPSLPQVHLSMVQARWGQAVRWARRATPTAGGTDVDPRDGSTVLLRPLSSGKGDGGLSQDEEEQAQVAATGHAPLQDEVGNMADTTADASLAVMARVVLAQPGRHAFSLCTWSPDVLSPSNLTGTVPPDAVLEDTQGGQQQMDARDRCLKALLAARHGDGALDHLSAGWSLPLDCPCVPVAQAVVEVLECSAGQHTGVGDEGQTKVPLAVLGAKELASHAEPGLEGNDNGSITSGTQVSGGTATPVTLPAWSLGGVAPVGARGLRLPHSDVPGHGKEYQDGQALLQAQDPSSVPDHPSLATGYGTWSMSMWLWLAGGPGQDSSTGRVHSSHPDSMSRACGVRSSPDQSYPYAARYRALWMKGLGAEDGVTGEEAQHRTPSAWLDLCDNRLLLRVSAARNYDWGATSLHPLPVRRWVHVVLSVRNHTWEHGQAVAQWEGMDESTRPATAPAAPPFSYSYHLYVDGVLDRSMDFPTEQPILANPGPLHIGGAYPAFPGPTGLIAGLSLYEQALEEEQVQVLWERGRPVWAPEEDAGNDGQDTSAQPDRAPAALDWLDRQPRGGWQQSNGAAATNFTTSDVRPSSSSPPNSATVSAASLVWGVREATRLATAWGPAVWPQPASVRAGQARKLASDLNTQIGRLERGRPLSDPPLGCALAALWSDRQMDSGQASMVLGLCSSCAAIRLWSVAMEGLGVSYDGVGGAWVVPSPPGEDGQGVLQGGPAGASGAGVDSDEAWRVGDAAVSRASSSFGPSSPCTSGDGPAPDETPFGQAVGDLRDASSHGQGHPEATRMLADQLLQPGREGCGQEVRRHGARWAQGRPLRPGLGPSGPSGGWSVSGVLHHLASVVTGTDASHGSQGREDEHKVGKSAREDIVAVASHAYSSVVRGLFRLMDTVAAGLGYGDGANNGQHDSQPPDAQPEATQSGLTLASSAAFPSRDTSAAWSLYAAAGLRGDTEAWGSLATMILAGVGPGSLPVMVTVRTHDGIVQQIPLCPAACGMDPVGARTADDTPSGLPTLGDTSLGLGLVHLAAAKGDARAWAVLGRAYAPGGEDADDTNDSRDATAPGQDGDQDGEGASAYSPAYLRRLRTSLVDVLVGGQGGNKSSKTSTRGVQSTPASSMCFLQPHLTRAAATMASGLPAGDAKGNSNAAAAMPLPGPPLAQIRLLDAHLSAWLAEWASQVADTVIESHGGSPSPDSAMHRLSAERADAGTLGSGQEGEDDALIVKTRDLEAQNDPQAMILLGRFYYWGERGLPVDHAQARQFFLRASDTGNVEGRVAAAKMLLYGEGGPKNVTGAKRLYERVLEAQEDHTRALNGLGFIHFNGHGSAPPPVPQEQVAADDADGETSGGQTENVDQEQPEATSDDIMDDAAALEAEDVYEEEEEEVEDTAPTPMVDTGEGGPAQGADVDEAGGVDGAVEQPEGRDVGDGMQGQDAADVQADGMRHGQAGGAGAAGAAVGGAGMPTGHRPGRRRVVRRATAASRTAKRSAAQPSPAPSASPTATLEDGDTTAPTSSSQPQPQPSEYIPMNRSLALEYFLRAAATRQEADSAYNAAWCLETSTGSGVWEGVPRNYTKAQELYLQAAEGWGHWASKMVLGRGYARGKRRETIAPLVDGGPWSEVVTDHRDPHMAYKYLKGGLRYGPWSSIARRSFDRYLGRDYDGAVIGASMAWVLLGEADGAANAAYLLERRLADWGRVLGARTGMGARTRGRQGHVDPISIAARLASSSWCEHVQAASMASSGQLDTDCTLFLARHAIQPAVSGAVPDVRRAASLYARAASAGSTEAAFALGHLYEHGVRAGRGSGSGWILAPDEAKAAAYYNGVLELADVNGGTKNSFAGMAAARVPVYLALWGMRGRAWADRLLLAWTGKGLAGWSQSLQAPAEDEADQYAGSTMQGRQPTLASPRQMASAGRPTSLTTGPDGGDSIVRAIAHSRRSLALLSACVLSVMGIDGWQDELEGMGSSPFAYGRGQSLNSQWEARGHAAGLNGLAVCMEGLGPVGMTVLAVLAALLLAVAIYLVKTCFVGRAVGMVTWVAGRVMGRGPGAASSQAAGTVASVHEEQASPGAVEGIRGPSESEEQAGVEENREPGQPEAEGDSANPVLRGHDHDD